MVMKLTTAQMMAGPMSSEAFGRWYVAEILRAEFPDFYVRLGPLACEEQTRNGRLYAEHFGIRRPDLQGQFLTIMWALGPSFFETPAFRRILERDDVDEAQKVDLLYDVSDADGAAAMAAADSRYWYPWLVEDNILGLTEDPALFDDLGPDDGWDD